MMGHQGRATGPLLGVIVILLLALKGCDAAGASVSLRARWQGTPYLLEAAEFLVGTLLMSMAGWASFILDVVKQSLK
jgi:hypothetical protein